MIALVQRVKEASVFVDGVSVGSIGRGLLVFLGIHHEDGSSEADWLARKCTRLRIFSDPEGQMNLSVQDIGGEILVVSQFTLYGNTTKGHRPSFVEAARPEHAEPLYEYFKEKLTTELGQKVASGHFGASMQVSLINDGPVTIWIERNSNRLSS